MKRQGAVYKHRYAPTSVPKGGAGGGVEEITGGAPTASDRGLDPGAVEFRPQNRQHVIPGTCLLVLTMARDDGRAREMAAMEREWLRSMQHWISGYDAAGGVVCRRCGKPGHVAAECDAPKVCNNCGKSGHLRYVCSPPSLLPS